MNLKSFNEKISPLFQKLSKSKEPEGRQKLLQMMTGAGNTILKMYWDDFYSVLKENGAFDRFEKIKKDTELAMEKVTAFRYLDERKIEFNLAWEIKTVEVSGIDSILEKRLHVSPADEYYCSILAVFSRPDFFNILYLSEGLRSLGLIKEGLLRK